MATGKNRIRMAEQNRKGLSLTPISPLSIPMDFSERQPNAFQAPKAQSKKLLNTEKGDACNVEQYQIIPHCNGTHTECYGHVITPFIPINQILKGELWLAYVVSIEPMYAVDLQNEHYDPRPQAHERLITRAQLQALLPEQPFDALIIRTLPNLKEKQWRTYRNNQAPYFTFEAMQWLSQLPLKHLLVDFPSVDREQDEGRLVNHRLFWGIEGKKVRYPYRTITEMIFVPSEIQDGFYGLMIQIPPFETDAAPSRPILYKL